MAIATTLAACGGGGGSEKGATTPQVITNEAAISIAEGQTALYETSGAKVTTITVQRPASNVTLSNAGDTGGVLIQAGLS
ncbi:MULTISPECIES: hypothetical protein [Marinobacter]|uniref:Uncharacterized protein n=1 Tax=Marinobacter xiaoshiensis TaxID=3073652 RepID=A0ABU2HC52_9GAMM|nr:MULTISPECIES: hypothetical protein [unclassified Marinobacter]MBK1887084.1 hypothetical protein [Marinobacter sp. DY40_1A1]MDS1308659.1 hypothetical protein [Marinobacter sp. F60267]